MKTLVLPGMDGGAELSKEFRALLGGDVVAMAYPFDEVLDYAALERRVRTQLGATRAPMTLVAESFSGPIAISIAASPPANLKRIILVATFDRPPAPSFLAPLVHAAMFRRAPPAAFIRWKMVGKDATAESISGVQRAIRRVDAPVLANRLRNVLRVDVEAQAQAISMPVLSLRGSKDRLVPRPLALAASHWREEVIDGHHLLLQQRPAACAAALRRFAAL